MPASTINERRRALYRIGGSGFTGAVFTVAALVSSPASATSVDGFARVEPGRAESVFFDPFRTFTNCLSAAGHSDSMYPGVDPDEVNRCLEDQGLL